MFEYGEYKGKPVLTLKKNEDDRFPFSMGKAKAKLIIENIEEVKKFASEE